LTQPKSTFSEGHISALGGATPSNFYVLLNDQGLLMHSNIGDSGPPTFFKILRRKKLPKFGAISNFDRDVERIKQSTSKNSFSIAPTSDEKTLVNVGPLTVTEGLLTLIVTHS